MPDLLPEIPPQRADLRDRFQRLRDALDRAVPSKALDSNLMVATWNLRAFGDLNKDLEAAPGSSPKRDLFSLLCIAEVVRRFDVVAVQEAKGKLTALRRLAKTLGPEWGLLLTDVTKGVKGNDERFAFLFDTRKVRPSGLACELVVPPEKEKDGSIAPDGLARQFDRTPYAASFVCDGKTFILVTVHIRYGKPEERIPELREIALWLSEWAKDMNSWDHNLIVLGDFNIDRQGDPRYQAFTSTGLEPCPDHVGLPRTIFDDPQKPSSRKFFDQVAWFRGQGGAPVLSLGYRAGGSFDFVPPLAAGMTKEEISWKVSDHYPLWVEFTTK
ncbi:MAG TPA: endonuclease/exonuclease/phosphatase family protein [Candidatus Thermoplasmatota archaeon]|nr:endonuclease/exonuclease/phosphatase family protein [Candidatus Thermoplasmatota archaeon]